MLLIGDTVPAADAGMHALVNAVILRKRETQTLIITER
jgi:hypothetical protein